jgi:hypothetical protein
VGADDAASGAAVIEQRLAISEGTFVTCPWCNAKRTICGLLLHLSDIRGDRCSGADALLCVLSRAALDEQGWNAPSWPGGIAVYDRLRVLGFRELADILHDRISRWQA